MNGAAINILWLFTAIQSPATARSQPLQESEVVEPVFRLPFATGSLTVRRGNQGEAVYCEATAQGSAFQPLAESECRDLRSFPSEAEAVRRAIHSEVMLSVLVEGDADAQTQSRHDLPLDAAFEVTLSIDADGSVKACETISTATAGGFGFDACQMVRDRGWGFTVGEEGSQRQARFRFSQFRRPPEIIRTVPMLDRDGEPVRVRSRNVRFPPASEEH